MRIDGAAASAGTRLGMDVPTWFGVVDDLDTFCTLPPHAPRHAVTHTKTKHSLRMWMFISYAGAAAI